MTTDKLITLLDALHEAANQWRQAGMAATRAAHTDADWQVAMDNDRDAHLAYLAAREALSAAITGVQA